MVDLNDIGRRRSRSSIFAGRNTAQASLEMGQFRIRVEADMTPSGLVAVGILVSSILLSVTPIILAATRKGRTGPDACSMS